jgi:hypothetical protein
MCAWLRKGGYTYVVAIYQLKKKKKKEEREVKTSRIRKKKTICFIWPQNTQIRRESGALALNKRDAGITQIRRYEVTLLSSFHPIQQMAPTERKEIKEKSALK